MNKMEFSGKTLDDALEQAAKGLGVERSAVSYNVLQQAKGGLLSKLFSRGVRIEAWADTADAVSDAAREAVRQIMERKAASRSEAEQPAVQERAAQPPRRGEGEQSRQNKKGPRPANKPAMPTAEKRGAAEAPARPPRAERKGGEPRPPRPEKRQKMVQAPRDDSALPEGSAPRNLIPLESPQATEVFDEFKSAFLRSFEISGENCTQSKDDSGNVILTIEDDYLEGILAKSDRLSLAFEHIFKRVAQKRIGDVGGRVFLSAGKANEIRQQALRDFAFSLAEKVKKTGKAITVASKTSQERRVIHLTLDGVQGVATKSVGSGERRRLIVFSTEARAARRNAGGETRSDGAEGTPGAARSPRSPGGQGKKRRGRGHRTGSAPQEPGASVTEERAEMPPPEAT